MESGTQKNGKRNLSLWQLFNLNIGFLGVQAVWSVQMANASRVFQTIGANPENISLFWIVAPLAGMVVQPMIGRASDRLWIKKLGRRLPFLYLGGLLAILASCIFPNTGNLGLGYATMAAMAFSVSMLLVLDVSGNMAMQPYKMLNADMVNEEQKGQAYSIMSIVVNIGGVLGSVAPFLITAIGISNVAEEGIVPDSTKFAFYAVAVLLLACCAYSFFFVKEMPPEQFAKFHNQTIQEQTKKESFLTILKRAPKVFWTLALVEFFVWAGLYYMWNFAPGGTAEKAFGWNGVNAEAAAFQDASNWWGILQAVSAVAAALSLILVARVKVNNLKAVWSIALLIGAGGFISMFYITDKWTLILSNIAIGIASGALNTVPFVILSNALDGTRIGSFLGLFNCSICVPQIAAGLVGKPIMEHFQSHGHGVQHDMFWVMGILFVIAAITVWLVKQTYGEVKQPKEPQLA